MSRKLADWIDSYLQYAENSEPPESYKKWVAFSAIAAVLQRKCYLQWEGTIYPNMYIVLVGPSGSRKGTAMRPVERFLRDLQIKLSPESVTREQLVRRLNKASEQSITPTGEVNMHASITIFSAELTVFLGYNNHQLMADLCDWFDCRDVWTYETKGSGQDHIINVWVNMIGGTTPRLLQTTLPQDAIGGGLTSRIIFVYERGKGKKVLTPFLTRKEVTLEDSLMHDLEDILLMQGEFVPDQSFIDCWINWYGDDNYNAEFSRDPRLAGYAERRTIHLLKLSMILNASRDGDMVLTSRDFERARFELTSIEKNMPMVFAGIGASDIADVTRAVTATICRYGEISFNELLGIHHDDADYEKLHRIVTTLIAIEKDGKKLFRMTDKIKQTIKYVGE